MAFNSCFWNIITVIAAVRFACSTEQIYWTLVKTPIVFGSEVQLACNITCCVQHHKESITSWAIEDDDPRSLSKNTVSTNSSKYEIFTSEHECRLTIKDFEIHDANKNYTCFYHFQRFSKTLILNVDNFEQQPALNSISTSQTVTDTELQINIKIVNVYPEPLCFANYNKFNITSGIKIESKRDKMLYNTTINVHHRMITGELYIVCRIGTTNHHIKQILIYSTLSDCSSDILICSVLWVVGVFIIFTCTCFAYIIRVKHYQQINSCTYLFCGSKVYLDGSTDLRNGRHSSNNPSRRFAKNKEEIDFERLDGSNEANKLISQSQAEPNNHRVNVDLSEPKDTDTAKLEVSEELNTSLPECIENEINQSIQERRQSLIGHRQASLNNSEYINSLSFAKSGTKTKAAIESNKHINMEISDHVITRKENDLKESTKDKMTCV